jgi:ribosomal-protein-alanine N-acetyltransferase
MTELRTDRLLLRRWRDEDRAPFAALTADPEVQRYFPAPLTRAEADAFVDQIEAEHEERGWSLWALEVVETGEFIGYTGLEVPSFQEHFTPAVEIGWRIARGAWGHGYVTEAARRALAFGFGELGLDEIVSFTVPENRRSRAVMERLGMTHDPAEDFEHPGLPEGHPLRVHVLYRLKPG